jgi:hypothetical protein
VSKISKKIDKKKYKKLETNEVWLNIEGITNYCENYPDSFYIDSFEEEEEKIYKIWEEDCNSELEDHYFDDCEDN